MAKVYRLSIHDAAPPPTPAIAGRRYSGAPSNGNPRSRRRRRETPRRPSGYNGRVKKASKAKTKTGGEAAREALDRLARAYPDWGCTLDFTTPFELLVATILAAQSTDETVNRVTKDL